MIDRGQSKPARVAAILRCRCCLRGVLALLLVLSAACASNHQPDLALLYRDWSTQKEGRPPLVGIHGLMGSEIINPNTGEVLWGRLAGLVRGDANVRLALPVEPGAESSSVPNGSIRKIAGFEIYGGINDTLIEMGGYSLSTESNPAPPAPMFAFTYDWRLSCAENAQRLAGFIASIQVLYHDPSLKVDIVAHSMGGLIARYYILYGDRDVLGEQNPVPTYAGAAHVRKLVMLGTPNMGSAWALEALVDGRRLGLAEIHPDLLATMPGMVELMASPLDKVLFTADGKPAPLDIYDPSVWRTQAWGIFNPAQAPGIFRRYRILKPEATDQEAKAYLVKLQANFDRLLQRARAFHNALDVGTVPASVRTLLLGGDCTPTRRAFVVEPEGGRWVVRPTPSDVRHPREGVDLVRLYYGPGDGDVTKASLLDEVPASLISQPHTDLPFAASEFICEKHIKLVKNWTFQDNLLNFLLYTPFPAEGLQGSSGTGASD
jgi:pimeloyl-ACP methyl ester carboxylesterase